MALQRSDIARTGNDLRQIDDAAAAVAHEVIVVADDRIVASRLPVKAHGTDMAVPVELLQITVNRAATDPRQPAPDPPEDLLSCGVIVTGPDGFEHGRQLACRAFLHSG